MQPQRVEKVKSLLAAALSRPPAEREAFLTGACSGDPQLRSDIDSYLGAGDKTDQFFYHADTVPNANVSLENPSAQVTVELPGDVRIGKQFGKYTIQNRLAEGGMGIVYLALDTQLGREVALKVLPEYFTMDRERLARFHREARATSLLNHPNIVTVFDIGQVDGCEFIVTEFVEGKTLRELMRQGQIPFVEMLKIASQIAGALATAHKAGIIHRDIKPENVMVRPDGYVKVLDFGLAKLTDTTGKTPSGNVEIVPSDVNHTVPGRIMGTVSYMAPEQAEGLETDARTDIWALGVILYEMAAGAVPFKGPSASHTIVAILERDPEELQNASPELRRLISTALQKDKALRFQTAQAMSAAIDDLKQRLGYVSDKNVVAPAPTERSIAVPRPITRPNPYRKLFWLVPAAFAVFLIGSLGIFAVVKWGMGASNAGPVEPPANTKTPTPEPTRSATPVPSPTVPVVYVDPTPKSTPSPAVTPTPDEDREPRTVRTKTPPPRPERDTQSAETKKVRTKKRKPTQDPNCVFTNSCN